MADVITLLGDQTTPKISYSSALEDAALTFSGTTDTDGEVENFLGYQEYTWFKPTGGGPYVVEATLDGSQEISVFCLHGHDASGNVAMETWNGSAWVAHSDVNADGSGSTLYVRGDTVTTTKLRFTFASVSYIAVLHAGPELILPLGVKTGFMDPRLCQRAVVEPETSRDGVWLGTAVQHYRMSQSISIEDMEADYALDYWRPFENQCSTQPFFLHWNTTDWPTSAAYCTHCKFSNGAFSKNGMVNVSVECQMTIGDETP